MAPILKKRSMGFAGMSKKAGSLCMNIYIAAVALLFVSTAVYGGIRHFSPVPFWDMWISYIPVPEHLNLGDFKYLWFQHSEHRIVFSKILFWIDIAFFKGHTSFLIVLNFLLMLSGFALFFLIIGSMMPERKNGSLHRSILAVIFCGSFSWLQHENISYAFQSQFFLAYLFPMAAFYFLFRSPPARKTPDSFFYISLLFGIASAGTMANGILALPIMTFLVLLQRQGYVKFSVLLFASVVVISVYFLDFQANSQHGSLVKSLKEHPVQYFEYIFAYIGGPFYHITGRKGAAVAAGLILTLLSVFFAAKTLVHGKNKPLLYTLPAFLLYVGGTAFATAGGRVVFGVEQAFASRYSTPALMAWNALFVLCCYYGYDRIEKSRISRWGILLLPLALISFQCKVFEDKAEVKFERKVGALAVELEVHDNAFVERLYPLTDHAILLSKYARENNLSIFGNPLFKDVKELVGKKTRNSPGHKGIAHIDRVEHLEGDPRYMRVSGWMFDPVRREVPEKILLVGGGTIQGYAVTGKPRPDVESIHGEQAGLSGFTGYLRAGMGGSRIRVIGKNPDCFMELPVDAPPFTFQFDTGLNTANSPAVVSSKRIVQSQYREGGVYEKEASENFLILGSHINGDGDLADISIMARGGEELFFRTGPVVGRQLFKVYDPAKKILYSGNLPLSNNWSRLSLSPDLPEGEFMLEITDKGASWGEWSAVALRKD